jgi:hypothetical protein
MAIGIIIVLAAGFLTTAILPEKTAATIERTWLSLGTDYPYNTGSTAIDTGGYVRECKGRFRHNIHLYRYNGGQLVKWI